ncbi:MAG: peptide chain release factor-like protein [Planctomycetia bacterium]|nr:peptide chain release factor-like protein [Planctomycetia bacterium]
MAASRDEEPRNSDCTARAPRATWSMLSDAERLGQCDVDTYRASGPGGQKRNKTSSAVRLRHRPTGLIVIAEESRSQHENKAKALGRLYRAFFLELRDPIAPTADAVRVHPDWIAFADGKLNLAAKNPLFWPTAGLALDVLAATQAQVSTAAELLGISTANLVEFLHTDPKLWQAANRLRAAFGHKLLSG